MTARHLPAFLIAFCACAAQSLAAEPPAAYLSAPARIPVGGQARIEALIVNQANAAMTLAWEAAATGLTIDPGLLKRQLWLAPKSSVLLEWPARAAAPGSASFALRVNGKLAGERTISVSGNPKPPAMARLAVLAAEPLVLATPDPARKFEAEIQLTAGARGERAATLAGLREVAGLSAGAIVAHTIVPAVLGDDKAAPDLAPLYAQQDASGGWPATPMAVTDPRTTSWVLLWLGHLARAGQPVNSAAVNAATQYLRSHWTAASPELRARIAAALASANRLQKEELAAFTAADAEKLSTAARLLATYAGADLPLPPKERWPALNSLELSVLILTLLERKMQPDALPLLPALAAARGPDPRFDTHDAALSALALHKLAEGAKTRAGGYVRVSLDGTRIHECRLGIDGSLPPHVILPPVALPADPAKPARLTISASGAADLFCRIRIRPVD